VDVSDLDLRAPLGQPAAERVQSALVRQLGEGVRLLEKLREPTGVEELVDRSLDRAGRDEAPDRVLLVERVLR